MSTIAISSKTSSPLGTRPPGTKVGTPLSTPRIMLIGTSYVVGGSGFGDTVGDSYQLMLHQYLVSCGVTPTWIGNLTRGTAPANKHRGAAGAKLLDHASGGTFDSATYVTSLGPVDIAICDLQVNDMNDAATADPDTFEANYITLGTDLYNAGAGAARIVITMMNKAGNDTFDARFPACWARFPAIQTALEALGALVVIADVRNWTDEANLYSAETDGSRLHPGDSGYLLIAEGFAPPVLNACGYNAAWYGEAATST